MKYVERPAPALLTGAATRFWFLETPPLRRYEKILPLPFMHVIFNLSDPYRLFDRHGTATTVADAFVSGLQSEYLVIESPPLIRHVGMELTPIGLHTMAPLLAAGSAGRVTPARDLLPGIDDLVVRLRASTGPEDALDAVMRHASDVRVREVDPLIDATLVAMQANVDIRIEALASRLGVSHRTLLSRFRTVTGTTPKRHAQVLRFHRFVDTVHESGGNPDWALLAAASGFYDQPHVIRAFHRFSGWTPAEYYRLVAEHGPEAAHFVPMEQVPVRVDPLASRPAMPAEPR